MYIGATEFTSLDTWVFNQGKQSMERRVMFYNPALLKIFDEILVNAADNKQRDPTMSRIYVSVSYDLKDKLVISVDNDGKGIPVQMHPTEHIHIPELIFGHLLTGSNFNDEQSRLTGGSHGYGAKLTNIFSKSFKVETYDSTAGLLYKQLWSNNMSSVSLPSIEKQSGKLTTAAAKKRHASYTKVTFAPDLRCFKMKSYSPEARIEMVEQMVLMFHRRCMDVAACIPPVHVRFNYNDSRIDLPVESFEDYIKLFHHTPIDEGLDTNNIESSVSVHDVDNELVNDNTATNSESSAERDPSSGYSYSRVNQRWEVGVRLSTSGSFESMSFVNNVWTGRGGTHVNLVTGQIVKSLEQSALKQGVKVSPTAIRNKLHVFVNCKIENPMFDGQTKDSLNSKVDSFGSSCELSDKFLKHIDKSCGILQSVFSDMAMKSKNAFLAKSKPSKKHFLDIPKLDDAHRAGSKDALQCTLILTEGDSAKALAVSGLEVVGRELFGVLPLRGKVM